MLSCELAIKLKQHMNREYCSAGIYIATSSWLFELEFIKAAQESRSLAQYSVTRFTKFYHFLSNYQECSFINQGVSSPCKATPSLEGIIDDILLDHCIRNECILEIEHTARIANNVKVQLFLEKIKPFYHDETHLLLSFLENYFLSKKIKLNGGDYKLSEIMQRLEPLHFF